MSGREHSVFTGLALIDAATGERNGVGRDQSDAVLRELIDAYLATGEPMDKAGAYGIQEKWPSLLNGSKDVTLMWSITPKTSFTFLSPAWI